MPKLNQIIAIEKGVKTRAFQELTEAHHALQKPGLLAGIARNYTPKDDEGEQLPSESTKVQVNGEEIINDTIAILTRLFDITLTKEVGNTSAGAAFVVDGKHFRAVPVTYLIFLEKQLVDLLTFVRKLPVLDQAETWDYDAASGSYATAPTQTVRTKKIPRNHVKAEATKEHAAQVEVYYEDVPVGYWRTGYMRRSLFILKFRTVRNLGILQIEAVSFPFAV